MRPVILVVLLAVALSLLVALGGCTSPETGPPRSDNGNDLSTPAAAIALGERSIRARACSGCHDDGDGTLAGRNQPLPGTRVYPANLTPDPDTGIGGWTDDEIARAIREGLDDEMAPLCATMPRYPGIDAGEMRALIAYLRSLPPVRRTIPASACGDPLSQGGAGDAGDDPGLTDAGIDDPSDLAAPPDAGPSCAARINELQTAGALDATEQLVELVNPCRAPLALDGCKLVYRSSAGVTDVTLLHLDGVKLAPSGFFLAASAAFRGAAGATLRTRMAAHGGGLAIRSPGGDVLDAVGWGDARNAFVQGKAAAAPDPGWSIGRIPDGRDSGDSSRDFTVTLPTPGARNR